MKSRRLLCCLAVLGLAVPAIAAPATRAHAAVPGLKIRMHVVGYSKSRDLQAFTFEESQRVHGQCRGIAADGVAAPSPYRVSSGDRRVSINLRTPDRPVRASARIASDQFFDGHTRRPTVALVRRGGKNRPWHAGFDLHMRPATDAYVEFEVSWHGCGHFPNSRDYEFLLWAKPLPLGSGDTTKPPRLVTAPHIDAVSFEPGHGTVGSTLTCRVAYSGATAVNFAWLRDLRPILGATHMKYTAQPADVHQKVTCETGGVNQVGATSGKLSEPEIIDPGPAPKPIHGHRPSVSGRVAVGNRLTAHHGLWKPAVHRFTYQWYDGSHKILGATNPTYVVKRSDIGQMVHVRVMAHLHGYQSGEASASPIG